MKSPIEKIVSALDLQSYQLNLHVSNSLAAVVIKHINFIEPLVSLNIQDPFPGRCLAMTPTNPYGTLKQLESKKDLFEEGTKSVTTEKTEEGIKRVIKYSTKKSEISVQYEIKDQLDTVELAANDIGIEIAMFQSVVDGIECRQNQIKELVESKDTIISMYGKEIRRASEGVVDLVTKTHEVSGDFHQAYAFFETPEMIRNMAQLSNILTLGKMKRNAINNLSTLSSGYLAWALLESELEQGQTMLSEDAEYLKKHELNELADAFRSFATQAEYSKQRVWRTYQTEKEDHAQLGFFPRVSDETILDAEKVLTSDEKHIVYET